MRNLSGAGGRITPLSATSSNSETENNTWLMKNDISERSPRIREILENEPRGLFWAGIGAILFGAVILIAVAYFLGWIF